MKWPFDEKKSRSITTLYYYRVLGDPISVGTDDRPQVNLVLSSQTSNKHGIWDKVQVTAFGILAKELLKEYDLEGKTFRVKNGTILTVDVINSMAPNTKTGGVYENHVLQEWTPVFPKAATTVTDKEKVRQDENCYKDSMMQFLYDTFKG